MLFSDFDYEGDVPQDNVTFNSSSDADSASMTFSGGSWVTDFAIRFTVAIDVPDPATSIRAAAIGMTVTELSGQTNYSIAMMTGSGVNVQANRGNSRSGTQVGLDAPSLALLLDGMPQGEGIKSVSATFSSADPVVPEPGTMVLLGAGLLFVSWRMRQ